MRVNRRKFLQGTAAAAAVGAFSGNAWADDPIGVASIHDLSGGLDIYGKPMVDALTLAVEEANAAGGLLGRQIKLNQLRHPVQHAALHPVCAAGGLEGQGRRRAWRHHLRLARGDPPGARRFKTLYFYNTQYEGGVCDRDQFDTGVTPAQTVEKLVPYAMKKWGKKVYVIAADYNYGQITSQWVKKYVTEKRRRSRLDRLLPARRHQFRLDHLENPGRQAGFRMVGAGRRRAYLVLSAVAAAGMRKSIPMASTTFAVGNEHIVLSPEECNGMLVCYNYFQDLKNKTNETFVAAFHKRFGED